MREINCQIRGIVPLLQHRFPEESEDTKTTKKTGRKDYSGETEVALFKNKNGVIYEPSEHIEGALRKAATSFQIPGKGKKTYKDLMLSSIVVDPTEIPIVPQNYEQDRRSVLIQRSRIFRYRPRFDEWELNFKIRILDDQIEPSAIKDILEYAGAAVGLGDYRPKFGRFEVTKFEPSDKP